jgi:hypothetical protein
MRIVLGIAGQIVSEMGRRCGEERKSGRKEFVKTLVLSLRVRRLPALKGIVMRFMFAAAWAVLSIVLVPIPAPAQTSIDGFGGVQMDHLASLGDSGFPVDFGGRVSFDVVPAVQVFGEFGRLGNVMPSLVEIGLAFTSIDLTASAFYGEGGVRLLAAPRSAISPYVEGTAGVANLRLGARGLGSTTDALLRAALNLVDTRDPLFGVGGGVLVQGGPLHLDVGYRYKRIVANSALSSVLSVGQELQSHQVRFGVGVRF